MWHGAVSHLLCYRLREWGIWCDWLMCCFSVSVKRRSWSWQQYLNEQKAEAAPPTLFTQVTPTGGIHQVLLLTPLPWTCPHLSVCSHLSPSQAQSFPCKRTCFKVGMKLEGIDPLHPSMFCVLTVAEVKMLSHTLTHTLLWGPPGKSSVALPGDWLSAASPYRRVLGVLWLLGKFWLCRHQASRLV